MCISIHALYMYMYMIVVSHAQIMPVVFHPLSFHYSFSQIVITNDFHSGNMPVRLSVDTDISMCNSDTAVAEPGMYFQGDLTLRGGAAR